MVSSTLLGIEQGDRLDYILVIIQCSPIQNKQIRNKPVEFTVLVAMDGAVFTYVDRCVLWLPGRSFPRKAITKGTRHVAT